MGPAFREAKVKAKYNRFVKGKIRTLFGYCIRVVWSGDGPAFGSRRKSRDSL